MLEEWARGEERGGLGFKRLMAGAEPRRLSTVGAMSRDLGAGVVEERCGVTMEVKLSPGARGGGGSWGGAAVGNRCEPVLRTTTGLPEGGLRGWRIGSVEGWRDNT